MKGFPFGLEVVTDGLFAENSYIAHLPESRDCLVIDPGLEPDKIIAVLNKSQLTPIAILNTHGHADHIAGNGELKARWPEAPLIVGHGDAPKLTDARLNLSAQYGFGLTSPPADRLVAEGETLRLAGFELLVWETPGHSAGHVVFVWRDAASCVVFGGDVLFKGGIGRSDFPDGDYDALVNSIHNKLFTLPDATIVLPGHGDATTIGREKRTNPFVGEPAGYRGK